MHLPEPATAGLTLAGDNVVQRTMMEVGRGLWFHDSIAEVGVHVPWALLTCRLT